MSITKRQAKAIFEELASQYKQELEEEREPAPDELAFNYPSDEIDGGELSPIQVLNLAAIPVREWRDLKVSSVSTFGDVRWNWENEGSPIYRRTAKHTWDMKTGDGLSLLAEEYAPLLNLMRAILFYWTPQNALFVNIKSFNSTAGAGTGLNPLCRFLAGHGLYQDRQGNGNFKTANDIASQDFHKFYEKLTLMGERTFFVRHVKYWWQLSQSGLLPAEYQLGYMVFDAQMITKAYKEFDEAKTPFLPIKLETLSVLTTHCLDIIEKYSEDILFMYELLWRSITGRLETPGSKFDWELTLEQLEGRQTTLWRMEQFVDPNMRMTWRVAMELRQTIMRHPDWEASPYYRSRTRLYQTPLNVVKEIAASLDIDVSGGNKAVQYDVIRVRREAMTMATNLRNACTVIIFLVTGMRRSELANLRVGNYWEVPGQPGNYRLRYIVFKTSEGSQGEEHEIPIPRIAYQALCLLERLTKHAREYGQTDLLMTNITINFGKPINLTSINAFLLNWCEDLGLSEMIHPHQFRKTLAMFLIYQDSGNLPLIKRLFSHKSLKMSLAYISELPGIPQEVKLALLEQNMELMSELLQAASTGVIGGVAGLRIKENFRSGRYAAMLNDDGWETIEQYVDSLLDEGVVLLHRAALRVICTKTPSIDQPAPCDPPYAEKLKRLHPNIQNCDPHDCKFAVFTESSVSELVDNIKAHEFWIDHPYANDDQKQFSQREIASCTARLLELGRRKDGSPISSESEEHAA